MSELPRRTILEMLNNSRLVRYLLLFALGWASLQVLAYFETVIIVFTSAAILAFLLNYPVGWLRRFLPRSAAVIIVFLLSLLILASLTLTIGVAILSQAQQLLSQDPELLDFVIVQIQRIENILGRWNLQLDLGAIEEQLREQALLGIGLGLTAIQQILTNLVDLILIAVVAFFMLLDGQRLWNLLLRIFPRQFRGKITETIQRNFLGFFWGRLILSTFFGVSTFIVFLFLQVPYPVILAAVGGVFDLVPGIGATIGITIIAFTLLPQGIWLSIQVLISCILLQQVEENLLMPRIMQDSINLNPVVMFFALLVGAKLAGLFGIFLAIPIAGVLISLFEIDEMQSGEDG
ncbi:MAG: AI-2E family transporter [Kastovskya adunca ATA6-11-RM4]|jgi:predicted PurR-regulated permease PerM|nr:AI-2E family transporter [Kastovskya adunca ATA6-11-RM4]